MRKSIAVLALAVTLAFTASSCAGDTKPITQADLTKQLTDVGKLKPNFAACVSAEVYPKLSATDRKDLNAAQPTIKDETALDKKAKAAGQACQAKGVSPNS